MHLLKLSAGLLFCFFVLFLWHIFWASDNIYNFSLLFGKDMLYICLKKQSLSSNETHPSLLLAVSKYLPGFFFFSYRQQSAEDLARVPANSTSYILNRVLVSYDPRIRPNFKGLAPPTPNISTLCGLKPNFISVKSFISDIQNSNNCSVMFLCLSN